MSLIPIATFATSCSNSLTIVLRNANDIQIYLNSYRTIYTNHNIITKLYSEHNKVFYEENILSHQGLQWLINGVLVYIYECSGNFTMLKQIQIISKVNMMSIELFFSDSTKIEPNNTPSFISYSLINNAINWNITTIASNQTNGTIISTNLHSKIDDFYDGVGKQWGWELYDVISGEEQPPLFLSIIEFPNLNYKEI
jgi:hypothetical protein